MTVLAMCVLAVVVLYLAAVRIVALLLILPRPDAMSLPLKCPRCECLHVRLLRRAPLSMLVECANAACTTVWRSQHPDARHFTGAPGEVIERAPTILTLHASSRA